MPVRSRIARTEASPWPDIRRAAISQAVDAVIGELGADSLKDMGKVMAALRERYAGRMDFAKASAAVKQKLA